MAATWGTLGYVYFVRAPFVERIKIGWASNPDVRFREIQAYSPIALEPYRLMQGTMLDERGIHAELAWARLTAICALVGGLLGAALGQMVASVIFACPGAPSMPDDLSPRGREIVSGLSGFADALAAGQRVEDAAARAAVTVHHRGWTGHAEWDYDRAKSFGVLSVHGWPYTFRGETEESVAQAYRQLVDGILDRN